MLRCWLCLLVGILIKIAVGEEERGCWEGLKRKEEGATGAYISSVI
jgi:hypothetical protein